ncbi:MAG: DUF2946 domain-containing protein [Pigmentiphaga sp.]|uniref:DUF2946 domain-containing protein n=1 Tax=Pigmentiphaga sp. TaxID=1977564 RepID=UPI0029B80CF3|nr:DUF2946 domain-containing protein [Pigmentiphaga sp.]MDX3904299.1 DUF2946 domain-containing protein [Pigmentiphaga sp.]
MHPAWTVMRGLAGRHWHCAAWWLALAVFVLKATIPQGFMPGKADGREAFVVLCSAGGPLPWRIALPGGDTGDDGPTPVHVLDLACPFAAAATPGLLAGPGPGLTGSLRVAYLLPAPAFTSQCAVQPARAPLGARAPPHSA